MLFLFDVFYNSIKDVTLDVAERKFSGERAYAVEECSCPTGYRGLSCEVNAFPHLLTKLVCHIYISSTIM